jgi:hypothetical protein
MGETRNVYSILICKPEGNTLLEKPRRIVEDDIKMSLKENRVGRCGPEASGSG